MKKRIFLKKSFYVEPKSFWSRIIATCDLVLPFLIRGKNYWQTEFLIQNLSSTIGAAEESQVSLKIRWLAER